jgi:membrane-associated protease RseP (regulator of RpoE activity)
MTMFLARMTPQLSRFWGIRSANLTAFAACVAVAVPVFAADEPPPAAFTPADISIGEPIALPVVPPTQSPVQAEPATRAVTAAVPGSGWLGVTVAESAVPGRWRIDDVVAGGPAARAGIAVGDELRAVNGITLKSLEEASQAVTAIAAGQEVRIAVARADAVNDLTLLAEPRPAAPAGRGWQGAEPGGPPPAAALTQPQPQAVTPPGATREPAPDVLPPPGAAAFAAAPQPFGAAGPVSAPTPAPGPAAFAPAIPAPVAEAQPRVAPDHVAAARGRTALGVRTLPIDPGIQARFHLPDPSGAYVIGVVQDLPASKAGVPPGSVIVALDNRPVRSPVELTQLVTSGPVDRPITVQFVLPGGEAKRAEVVLQSLEVPLERVLIGSAPTGVRSRPALRTAEKPLPTDAARPLIDEIRNLRDRLDRLERRLQAVIPSR